MLGRRHGVVEYIAGRRYKFIADPGDVRIGETLVAGASKADVVLLGAPWDGAVGTRPGSRQAPAKLRQTFLGLPYRGGFSISDWGDVNTVVGDHEESWRRVSASCLEALSSSKLLLLLGGDSTVSYCAFKALRTFAGGSVSYLSLDAHPDVRIVNEGLTSGQVVRWIRGVDADAHICVVGVRRHSNAPYLFGEAESLNVRVYTVEEALRDGGDKLFCDLESLIGHSTLHLSVNMDVVDPAYAPGVNSPSPGGFTSREIIGFVRRVAEQFRPRIVDLVEYTPAYDQGDITALLGSVILNSAIWL
jgi:agmatinase